MPKVDVPLGPTTTFIGLTIATSTWQLAGGHGVYKASLQAL